MPPRGDQWLHEAKLDGWRVQIVKDGRQVRLFSKSGGDLTKRLAPLAAEIAGLPVRKAVIDGELVLVDERSVPDFHALQRALTHRREEPFVVFAFDLLDLRDLPLVKRKRRLVGIISETVPAVQMVDLFDDGAALLQACAKMRLEGVASKRRDAPYRSGPSRSWVKVKTEGWRAANRERWRLFER